MVHSTPSATRDLTLISPIGPGMTMWLFGAIGRTADWNQPVSRYTLDGRYVSTVTAQVKNETSYNEPLAYFYNLDASSHTLVVENVNEGATLFLDYYLVEPIPMDRLATSTGNLQTGGMPYTTSTPEAPASINGSLSGGAMIGTLLGAVAGGVLLALMISITAFVIWRRRGGSKPYYYRRAAVHEVLLEGVHKPPRPHCHRS